MIQRYSIGPHRPDRDAAGEFVRLADVQAIFSTIIDDASPCTTACHSLVSDAILTFAAEEFGINRDDSTF